MIPSAVEKSFSRHCVYLGAKCTCTNNFRKWSRIQINRGILGY
jgi:hypothetical protein